MQTNTNTLADGNTTDMVVSQEFSESSSLPVVNSEDKIKYDKIAKSLNSKDINSIVNYGCELQNQATKASNSLISSVRTRDINDELGLQINSLMDEIGSIDIDELKPKTGLKGFIRKIPILRSIMSNVEKIWNKYDTIEKNIDTISNKIMATRLQSLQTNTTLQKDFQHNLEYSKLIEDHIVAGKLKIQELTEQLNTMKLSPEEYDEWEISDLNNFINNLERRIADLAIMQHVFKESLPKIRLIQYNNIQTANKAQSIISTTLPIWKSELAMAVALTKQKKAVELQRKVSDATNEIIKKNADLLYQNSIDIARENERSVIDIESLKHSTGRILDVIRECKEIHQKGVIQRNEIESELVKLDQELQTNIQRNNLEDGSNYISIQ